MQDDAIRLNFSQLLSCHISNQSNALIPFYFSASVETGDHTTARSRAEADGVKVLLQTVVGPLVQTMVERHWQTEMLWSLGVHFYRWCALPLVMPPSASCNARHTPGTRQAHAYNATMAPWNLSHGLLAPLLDPFFFHAGRGSGRQAP